MTIGQHKNFNRRVLGALRGLGDDVSEQDGRIDNLEASHHTNIDPTVTQYGSTSTLTPFVFWVIEVTDVNTVTREVIGTRQLPSTGGSSWTNDEDLEAKPLTARYPDNTGHPTVGDTVRIDFTGNYGANREAMYGLFDASKPSLIVKESDDTPIVDPTSTLTFVTSDFIITDEGNDEAKVALRQTPWSLTVEESDGSPSVNPVDTLAFDYQDFTVMDNGSGKATVSLYSHLWTLVVRESDGTPNVSPATVLTFATSDFIVVDETLGEASVSLANAPWSLTVQESDGTPSVEPVDVITFCSSHFTIIDSTGGGVSIDLVTTLVTFIAAFQVNTTDKTLEVKYQSAYVFHPSSLSGWTVVHSGDTC